MTDEQRSEMHRRIYVAERTKLIQKEIQEARATLDKLRGIERPVVAKQRVYFDLVIPALRAERDRIKKPNWQPPTA